MNSCEYYADRTFLPYNPTLERVAPSGVADITTDQYFTTMVYANGEVKTFGLNNGALGNGVYVDTSNLDAYKRHVYNPTPVKFILPPGAPFLNGCSYFHLLSVLKTNYIIKYR